MKTCYLIWREDEGRLHCADVYLSIEAALEAIDLVEKELKRQVSEGMRGNSISGLIVVKGRLHE